VPAQFILDFAAVTGLPGKVATLFSSTDGKSASNAFLKMSMKVF